MTTGFRSSEFAHASVVSAVGIGLCAVGLWKPDDVLAICGSILLALSTAAYSHSRGRAKQPRPYLPPQAKL